MDDAGVLLLWRNDSTTRLASRDECAISAKDHEKWLARCIADPERILLIGESSQGNEKFGMVRFDLMSGALFFEDYEVSIIVAPEVRGRGLSKTLLSSAEIFLSADTAVQNIFAYVKKDNALSTKLFSTCGYYKTGESDGVGLWFKKSLVVE